MIFTFNFYLFSYLILCHLALFRNCHAGASHLHTRHQRHWQPLLRTPKGRSVPLSLVRLRRPAVLPARLGALLFDVRDHVLYGPNSPPVALLHQTTPYTAPQAVDDDDSLTQSVHVSGVRLIANETAASTVRTVTRTGRVYTVVSTADVDSAVLSVSAPALRLELLPLDMARFPGVFINMHILAGRRQAHAGLGPLKALNASSHTEDAPVSTAEGQTSRAGMSFSAEDAGRHGLVFDGTGEHPGGQALAAGVVSRKQRGSPCHLGDRVRILRVAVATDQTFCAAYGGNAGAARAALAAKFQLMAGPYLRQTCVKPVLSHVELHCPGGKDPYGELRKHLGRAPKVLAEFRAIWNKKRGSVPRDVVFYYPGYEDRTEYAGMAYVGRLCQRQWAYGWAEGLSPLVMAHELGHVLNCDHTPDGGVMTPFTFTVPDPEGLRFSATSLKQLYAFVDRRPCLKTATGSNHTPKKTCTRTLKPEQTLSCGLPRRVAYVKNQHAPADYVQVIATQEFDYIKVTFVAAPGTTIKYLATAFGLYEVGYQSDLGRRVTYPGKGRTSVEVKVKMSSLAPPFSLTSCCGERMGILFDIKYCGAQSGRCAQGFHGFWGTTVGCITCPSGMRVVRQSASNKCGLCV